MKREKCRKQFCIHGHDITETGRFPSGSCIACKAEHRQKLKEHKVTVKRICKRGHDTKITGRDNYGICNVCRRERDNKKYVHHPRKPTQFCPKGHDTFKCGRTRVYGCNDCDKELHKKIFLEIKTGKRTMKRIKKFCINGHEIAVVGRNKYGECKQCKTEYQQRNKESIVRWRKKYLARRFKHDIIYKIKLRLRSRLRDAIRKGWKVGSAVRDLGCPIEFFKKYIEKKFKKGMTWDNWGPVWELDHIKALMFFDLTDRKQFLKAANYKNMQPLIIEDHQEKTNKELNRLAKLKAKQK